MQLLTNDNSPIFLAQSDTTAGFLCADFRKLNYVKGRDSNQNVLLTLDSLHKLRNLVRPPNRHKNRIRRSAKSTFVYKNPLANFRWQKSESLEAKKIHKTLAIRVVKAENKATHADFLRFFPFLYSTSANAHNMPFGLDFALKNADIVVLDKRGFAENNPSKMYKISNSKIKCIR